MLIIRFQNLDYFRGAEQHTDIWEQAKESPSFKEAARTIDGFTYQGQECTEHCLFKVFRTGERPTLENPRVPFVELQMWPGDFIYRK